VDQQILRSPRIIGIVVLMLVGGGANGYCQLPHGAEVTVGKVAVETCDWDPGLALARIHVTVEVANRGKNNLILSRNLEGSENYVVADDSGKSVYTFHPTEYGTAATAAPHFGDIPDDKLFEIIPPGSSASRDFAITVPISKSLPNRAGSAPAPGNYKTSGQRRAWPFFDDGDHARQVRRKWERYGELLIGPIQVRNVPVQVSLPKNIRECEP
jgi:hypothetical protein